MTLTPWTHENAFLPGTIVRADAMNLKLDGIAQAIQAICNQINQKIPNLPATFTGETQIPEKTLPNTLLLINSAGAMDLYPKAQFDTDVANAASAAVQAATSATNAQNSASQAQVHEQNAEEHAEAAFNSATAAATFAESAEQAKDDTMSALNTRLGTTGNLGTAAQRPVMTSLTDTTTTNALMPRGAFGLGGNVVPLIGSYDSTSIPNGLYLIGPSNPGRARPYSFGYLQVVSEGTSGIKHILHSVSSPESYVSQYTGGAWTAWGKEFNSFNIVGPAGSVGGVPSGAIIERGGNVNGSYVRTADGTQICWFASTQAYGPVTNDNGLVYSANITWNYPAQFVVPPTTFYTPGELIGQGTPICWAKGAGKLGASDAGLTSDSPIYLFFSQMGGFTYRLRGLAIGRWY